MKAMEASMSAGGGRNGAIGAAAKAPAKSAGATARQVVAELDDNAEAVLDGWQHEDGGRAVMLGQLGVGDVRQVQERAGILAH